MIVDKAGIVRILNKTVVYVFRVEPGDIVFPVSEYRIEVVSY